MKLHPRMVPAWMCQAGRYSDPEYVFILTSEIGNDGWPKLRLVNYLTPVDTDEQEKLRGLVPEYMRPDSRRTCHVCGLPIPDTEGAVEARGKNAWAHFECWYDGAPLARDPKTGAFL